MNKRVSGRQFFQMGQMKSGEKEGHQKGPTPDKRIHTCWCSRSRDREKMIYPRRTMLSMRIPGGQEKRMEHRSTQYWLWYIKKSWCIINMFPFGLCFSFLKKIVNTGNVNPLNIFLNDRNESGGHRGKNTISLHEASGTYLHGKIKTNAIFAFCFEEGGN